jgi:hypothetical protein
MPELCSKFGTPKGVMEPCLKSLAVELSMQSTFYETVDVINSHISTMELKGVHKNLQFSKWFYMNYSCGLFFDNIAKVKRAFG